MKTRRILSVILILAMLMSLITACEVKGDKWVLTKEVKEYSDEYDTPTISYQKTFEYDLSGRIVTEKETDYDFDIWYSSYDFEYNDNGQVITKTVESDDETFSEHNISHYEYKYNSYGNCVSEKVVYPQDPDTTYYTEYTYDKNGNVIEEYYKDTIGGEYYEVTKSKKLTYEDDKCIQAEITTISSNNIAYFSVEQFIYDENKNLSQILYYTGIENSTEAKSPLTIGNRNYKLDYTITYTYEKLKDVAIKKHEYASNFTTTITAITTTNLKDIGFYNIEEWGSKLIEVQTNDRGDYIFEDNFGKYVIIKEGTGIYEFYPNQKQVIFSSYYVNRPYSTEASGTYTILDNDTFTTNGYAIRIINRFSIETTSFIQMTNGGNLSYLYIPYVMLNQETMKLYEDNGRLDSYKCYLK